MYIPNLKDYHECSPIDIAKRRGIYVSEVQDAIVELSNQVSDIYTFAITDNEDSIEKGTDVIFSTSDGNFVWDTNGDFELIENTDDKEVTRDRYGFSDRKGFKGKTRWDYLRQGDFDTFDEYIENEKVQQRRQETIASDRNRYARAIKKGLVDAGADNRTVFINNRAKDLSVKVASWGVQQIGSVEKTTEVIEDIAKSLGISVSVISKPASWKEAVIASVPYYNR